MRPVAIAGVTPPRGPSICDGNDTLMSCHEASSFSPRGVASTAWTCRVAAATEVSSTTGVKASSVSQPSSAKAPENAPSTSPLASPADVPAAGAAAGSW